jgi:lipopolysaccharide transport system ATP-binding protein
MHSDIAISVRNLTKTYRIFGHPGDRIKQTLALGRQRYYREFTALKDVSVDIKKGDFVGIVGRNGSGKSTLLQLVCGILKPTQGRVNVEGRISALLELGAGFNPEFTGRENVFFQGAVLGVSKETMSHRFDQIAAFADIGEFIDQPVRVYSSGMYLRLAFATAVNVDPEILVVDEALAVGDAGFRARCFRRIGELRDSGCTILLVTHDMEQVLRFCNLAILMDDGEVLLTGTPELVVKHARVMLTARSDTREIIRQELRKCRLTAQEVNAMIPSLPTIDGDNHSTFAVETYDPHFKSAAQMSYEPNGAVIDSVHILCESGQRVNHLRSGHRYRCVFQIRFTKDASNVRFAFLIKTAGQLDLGGAYSVPSPVEGIPSVCAGTSVEAEFAFNCVLNPGTYFLSVSLFGSLAGMEFALHGITNAEAFRVIGNTAQSGISSVDFGSRASIRWNDKPQ